MLISVFGPNLADQSKGQWHVHAAECGDCRHYGPTKKYGGDFADTFEWSSVQDIVEDICSDMVNDGEQWEDMALDFHLFPCAKELPYTE